MTAPLLRARAAHQRVAGPAFPTLDEAIAHFGCIQSQDYAMSKWALARRVDGVTDQATDEALAAGRFLRTHILRPTWHLVLPADLPWMMRITAPRVHRLMATFNKTIKLFQPELDAAAAVIVSALTADQPQTRAQLTKHLSDAGIEASGPHLAHLFINAELELLICSGPLIGKQHSYVLAPPPAAGPTVSEDDALARLARTYVRGHGPSQPADLAWWSSLTLTQARKAFDLAELRRVTIDGVECSTDDTELEIEPPAAAMVPPFDESISYVDKPLDPVRFPGFSPDLARGPGLLFLDGVIGGGWSRKLTAKRVEITVSPLGPITPTQRRSIEADTARLGSFLGLEPELHVIG